MMFNREPEDAVNFPEDPNNCQIRESAGGTEFCQ